MRKRIVALSIAAVVTVWLGATLRAVNHHEADSANTHASASVHNAVLAQHYRNRNHVKTIREDKEMIGAGNELRRPEDSSPPLVLSATTAVLAESPPPRETSQAAVQILPPPPPPPPLPPPAPPLEAQQRIVAIGDIHGDLGALKRALLAAEVIDAADTWIGGTTAVIQIGDLVNNAEESDRAVLSYAQRLHEQADASGGSFRAVWGDHDVENLPKLLPKPFVPPEWFSLMLVVEGTLFVHGGLVNKALIDGGGIDAMNAAVTQHLTAKGDPASSPEVRQAPAWFEGPSSPMWSRRYSEPLTLGKYCRELEWVLNEANVARTVVGHTVRPEGVSPICNGLAWRVDVGLASTESQAGQAGFEASQTLEILTSPGCIQDCISRKRSEDKLRVVGVNEASMGKWSDINPIPPFTGLNVKLGSIRGQ